MSCKLGTGIAGLTRVLNVKHSQMETLHRVAYGIMSTCIFVVLFVKSKVVSLQILLLQSLLMQTVYNIILVRSPFPTNLAESLGQLLHVSAIV